MEPNKKTSSKCGDVLLKGSSFLSFISLLLIVALFLRMESINRKTEINELRISKVESRIDIRSQQTTDHRNEMDTPEYTEKTTNTKVRRSLISVSNKSLSVEDVRSEITKQFNKLKPASLCQPLEKVCVPGPPGQKGSKGSRGRRGVQGAKGKKGKQGIMGLPGRHGQQGIMGNQGEKGEKGEKGDTGPRGFMGLKGDPGESISSPEVTVSPVTQTVTQNQTATFNCSVRGSPKPKVTWSKVNGSLVAGSFVSDKNGALKITKSTFSDSGDYMCIAVNVLGSDERTATLIVEGKKKKKKLS
ncbi:collectin-12-like [Orbicella faveolata]|uniref:collectin-12-like n=1 Tax=Orbicella faveolata TaxID=48498 RepID=UPI0009E2EEF8|nr:collectin-12-like [Orbicella faveolata]